MSDAPIKSPDTARAWRIPPGQKLTDRFPVLHYGPVHRLDRKKWKFALSGLTADGQEHVLTWDEFQALPRVQVFSDIHCVTGWTKLDNTWDGVSARTVYELTGVRPEARFVLVHGAGGFTTNLPLDDFLQDDVLFATHHNGAELSPEHGYPVRLVVPRLYFWKSAKWATGVEYLAQDRPGFWEVNGYHNHGDPWKQERYSSR
jgi:DMSO/TMAO reductase YedYZ molybdopterin-dependent catalytic subunit